MVEKLPFLALSIFAGLLTVHAERGVGALPSATLFPLQFRLANAVLLLALPCPNVLAGQFGGVLSLPGQFLPRAGRGWRGFAAAGFSARLVECSPPALFDDRVVMYLATLLPVIGLIQVGSHAHADRKTDVPLIGVFVLLAWGTYDDERPATPGFGFVGHWHRGHCAARGADAAADCVLEQRRVPVSPHDPGDPEQLSRLQ